LFETKVYGLLFEIKIRIKMGEEVRKVDGGIKVRKIYICLFEMVHGT
jgi:hypothetical protein